MLALLVARITGEGSAGLFVQILPGGRPGVPSNALVTGFFDAFPLGKPRPKWHTSCVMRRGRACPEQTIYATPLHAEVGD